MCGRFVRTGGPPEISEWFGIPPERIRDLPRPSFNIAPGGPVAAVADEQGPAAMSLAWGFRLPSGGGSLIINARSETLSLKPIFRENLGRRRCLIVADGFYEWGPGEGRSQPFYFSLGPGRMMALAGLYQPREEGGGVSRCAIITVPANARVVPVHRRMPAIIAPDRYREWLDPELTDPGILARMLRPWPPEDMVSQRVGRLVNSTGNDSPECIKPV
jgi:putative SOS response-associated peptidase YedK